VGPFNIGNPGEFTMIELVSTAASNMFSRRACVMTGGRVRFCLTRMLLTFSLQANLVKEVVNPEAEIVFRENTSDDPGRRK